MRLSRRELRGMGIVIQGGQIKRLNDRLFSVKSQGTDGASYKVQWTKSKWKCECPDYLERKMPCKHVFAVNFLLNLPTILISNATTLERTCPYCGSDETILKGFRYNKTGATRLRECKKCHKRFKDGLIAESKGANNALGLIAFDLYLKGMSLRNIRNHLWQVFCIDKSVSTLHRWIVKLTDVMKSALSEIKMEVGDKWLGDETIVKVRGQTRYLWNIMDFETRCHIVSILTEGRGSEEALMVIREAIKKAGKEPQTFVSDGLKSYPKAMAELGENNITHVSNVGIKRIEE
jgi:transposase-like protein/DNA-directed RNA polymerase subunit M/transcription elongation factor TFIIS